LENDNKTVPSSKRKKRKISMSKALIKKEKISYPETKTSGMTREEILKERARLRRMVRENSYAE
jgi:hypothetical protein